MHAAKGSKPRLGQLQCSGAGCHDCCTSATQGFVTHSIEAALATASLTDSMQSAAYYNGLWMAQAFVSVTWVVGVMQVDFLMSGLMVLKERIDATEALIAIDLDNRRNELVAFDLVSLKAHPSAL